MLGDSVLLGAKDQLTAELEASGYTVDYRASAAEMIHQGNKALLETGTPVGETVVVGLGHNSLWERDRTNYDKWARKFNGEADELIQTLESLGAKKIVWVTLREPSESVIPPAGRKQFDAYVWYFPYVNEQLRLLPQRHPDVRARRLGRGVQPVRADVRRDAPDEVGHPPDDRHHPVGRPVLIRQAGNASASAAGISAAR